MRTSAPTEGSVKTAATKAAADKKVAPRKKAAPARQASAGGKVAAKKTAAKGVGATKGGAAKRGAAKGAGAAKGGAAKAGAATKRVGTKPGRAVSATAPPKRAAAAKRPTGVKRAAPTKRATPATETPSKRATPAKAVKSTSSRAVLPVRTDESPWTPTELRDVRAELEAEIERARIDLATAEAELQGLLRDAGDGAGDDQADAGSNIFDREHEMSMANNSRDKIDQIMHALERLDNGTYGICESCESPIGKFRLQAAPRATLCVTCKQKQERR